MNEKKKILIVATVVRKHIMQFHLPTMKMLREHGWTVEVAARNDYPQDEECNIPYCDTFYDVPFERKPFRRGNITAYKKLREIIDCGDYDVIHCHTPVGGILGRLAAKKARKHGATVMYTAHGFHFFKGASISGWLLFYPAEKLAAPLTDKLITINEEDYSLAKKRLRAREVLYLPGMGIDREKYSPDAVTEEEKRNIRASLGLLPEDMLLLSVGELIKRKNHAAIIDALAKINDKRIKYFICGSGDMGDELLSRAKSLGLDGQVFLLGYRRDIPSLLCCADLFVLPSLQEGLPFALMEAIASKVRVLSSDIRGSRELLPPECRFDPRNADDIANKIKAALFGEYSYTDSNYKNLEKFTLENVMSELEKIYGLK